MNKANTKVQTTSHKLDSATANILNGTETFTNTVNFDKLKEMLDTEEKMRQDGKNLPDWPRFS